MEFRRLAVVLVVVATVTAFAGLPIAAGAVTQESTTDASGGESAPMGTQMTAFMQHSAGQADDAVDDGMWVAAFERANESERARLATARAHSLGERLDELREEREVLRAQRENGTLSGAEYAAAASELNGRIDALREGVNGTERAAERAGLDVERLETLKENAHNMTGAEVAGVARGLAGNGPPPGVGPPSDVGRPTDVGPPTDLGPPGTTSTETNGTDAPPGGPPEVNPGGNEPGGGDGPGGPGSGAGPGGPGAGEGQSGGGPPGGGSGGNEEGGGDDGASGSGQSGNSGNGGNGGNGGSGGSGSSGSGNPGQGDGPPN